MKGIFITATDTGVGKTVVAALLTRILRNRGISVGVMKPVTSGCQAADGQLVSEDAELLAWSAGAPEVTSDMAPYLLRAPIAPMESAKREQVRIDFRLISDSFDNMAANHDFLVVEGAGGLMVPLAEGMLIADLIKFLALPALVVARPDLGTVNHTLLTCAMAGHYGIDVRGVIINNFPEHPGIAEESAPGLISSFAGSPLLAVIPNQNGASPREIVINLSERLKDDPAIERIVRGIGAA